LPSTSAPSELGPPRSRRRLLGIRLTVERRRRLVGLLFLLPVVIYICVLYGYPLVVNALTSFENYSISSFYTGKAPLDGLVNYRMLWHSGDLGQYVETTVIFTACSLAAQFGIGLALAVFFKHNFPLNSLLRSLLLLPWLLPVIVSATIYRWVLDQQYGVLNQVLLALHFIGHPVPWLDSGNAALASVILVNVWAGVPFNMVILFGGLQTIPEDRYEAAAIDGAGASQRFRYVTLPLLKPVTLVVLMLGLIYTLRAFDVIYVLTQGGPGNATQTLTTWSYLLTFQDYSIGEGAAVSNLLMVVIIILGLLYIRTTRETEASTS